MYLPGFSCAFQRQQRPRVSRLSRHLLLTSALLAGGLAGATGLNISISTGTEAAPTGTANFNANSYDGTNYAGMDSTGENLVVRTNDTITYNYNMGNLGGTTDSHIVITTTLKSSYESWALPYSANCGDGSKVEGQTFTCYVKDPLSAGARGLLLTVKVKDNTPNGTVLPTPEATIRSDESPTLVSNTNTQDVVATAAPRYDLSKSLPNNATTSNDGNYTIRNVPGPDGTTPGYLISLPIVISAMDSIQSATNDELKGLSPLASPITFTDDLTQIVASDPTAQANFRAKAVLYNPDGTWKNALSSGGCAPPGSVPTGGMDYNVNGDCVATQPGGAGNPVQVTITGLTTDDSLNGNDGMSRFAFSRENQAEVSEVYNSRLAVLQRVLLLWVPADAIPAGQFWFRNTYTNFKATSVDGQPNQQPAMQLWDNATSTIISDPTGTRNDTNYFTLGKPGEASSFYAKWFNSDVTYEKGATHRKTYTDGTTGTSLVGVGNNSSTVDLNKPILCEKFDNTKFIINPDSDGSVVSAPNASGGRGVVGTDFTVEYGTGGLNGVGDTWARDGNEHSLDQANATCSDDQSPHWYTSLAEITAKEPAGLAAITKIRVKLNYSLRGSQNSYYGTSQANVGFRWKATSTPQVGPNKGKPYAQAVNMDNWATVSTSEYSQRNDAVKGSDGSYWVGLNNSGSYTAPYSVSLGDEAFLATGKTDISVTIPKVVQPSSNADGTSTTSTNVANGSSVAIGSTVTYQLHPTYRLAGVSSSIPTEVTVTDVLPKGMTYVPGSASLAPASVTKNSDGSTTIVWKLENVLLNSDIPPINFDATVDPVTANNVNLDNTVSIVAPSSDPMVKSADIKITASSSPGVRLLKTVLTPYVAPQGVAEYKLAWYSIGSSNTGNVQFIDILPYNNDGRGTNNVPQGLASAPAAPANDSSMTFYYTAAAPETIKADPSDPSNDLTSGSADSTKWYACPTFSTTSCPITSLAAVTAVRGISTKPAINSNEEYSTVIRVQTSADPHDGDRYDNSFNLRSSNLTFAPSSAVVTARVRLLSLTGTVYNDTNRNGTKDGNEDGLGGVSITLSGYTFGPDGLDGGSTSEQAITPLLVQTNDDGTFTFPNLAPGRYTLSEVQPDGYTTTSNAAGTAGGTVGKDDDTETISDIVLSPTLASAPTGYLFGEAKDFIQPDLKKWGDNCGQKTDLSGCPAVHTASDATTTVPTEALPSDIVRYTIILNNTNALALAQAIIHDDVPANTTFMGAAADIIPAGTGAGLPLASYTSSPSAWNTCTTSSTAVSCTLPSGTAAGDVRHLNIGWNSDADSSGISSSDSLPASTQLRVTFWVRVN